MITKKYLEKYYDPSKFCDYIESIINSVRDNSMSQMEAMTLMNIIRTLDEKSKGGKGKNGRK